MADMVLEAEMFAPLRKPDTTPFGIDNSSGRAVAALRALADAMEKGAVVVKQSQTGATAQEGEFVHYRVFLEYVMKPW